MEPRRKRSPQSSGRLTNDGINSQTRPQSAAYYTYHHPPVDPSIVPPRSLPPPSWPQAPALLAQPQQYSDRSYQPSVVPSNHQVMAGVQQYPLPTTMESHVGFQGHQHQPSPHYLTPGPPSSYSHPLSAPQRRTFRSRRKDPSCDSCRERKVKCDATESASCSECVSRSVRCQFTKETNRRMSSSRTVQDLERQLAEHKQVIKQLSEVRATDAPSRPVEQDLAETPRSAITDPRPRSVHLSTQAQRNIRQFSYGIFEAPFDTQRAKPSQSSPLSSHKLPPVQAVDRLLPYYYHSIHRGSMIFDWDHFIECYNAAYKRRSFATVSSGWIALFYAVLAVSTLLAAEGSVDTPVYGLEGRHLIEQTTKILGGGPEHLESDHCYAALLASMYYVEINERSAGRKYLTCAVELAYDIGLHEENETLPVVESEYRRRLWWWVYSWDRLESFQTSKPPHIHDDECTVRIPRPLTEAYAEAQHGQPPQPILSPLELAIPIVSLISQVRKALKAQVVPAATLHLLEQQLDSIARSWPVVLQATSSSYLDPNLLWLATAIPCMSLLVYRHNLTPASTHDERNLALKACLHAAQSTTHLINRTFQPHPSGQTDYIDPGRASLSWEQRVASMTPAHLCAHLWRCALILCLCLDIDSATTCARVSAAIGSRRRINIACGRNLRFFLTQVSDRIERNTSPENAPRSGHAPPDGLGRLPRIDQDEEMIAYATGDLQGDARSSWVWTGAEMMGAASSAEDAQYQRRRADEDSNMDQSPRFDEETDEWPRVMGLLQSLRPYQRQRLPPQLSSGGSSSDNRSKSGYSPGSSKRISIANII